MSETNNVSNCKNKIFALLLLRWFQSSWRGVRQICRKINDFSAGDNCILVTVCKKLDRKSWIIACLIYIYIWRGVFKISFSISYFKVIQRNVRCLGKDMKIGWASQEDRAFSQRFQLIGIKDSLKCFCEENRGFSTHNCDQKQYVFRWRLWWFFSVTYDSQRSSESCIWLL